MIKKTYFPFKKKIKKIFWNSTEFRVVNVRYVHYLFVVILFIVRSSGGALPLAPKMVHWKLFCCVPRLENKAS